MGGIYADESIPLSVRATSLLVDTLGSIHDALTVYCVTNAERLNLAETGPILDEIAESITQVRVVGTTEEEQKVDLKVEDKESESYGASFTKGIPKIEGKTESTVSNSVGRSSSKRQSGKEVLYVNLS